MRMERLKLLAASLALFLMSGTLGCTMYPEKKQPTLASTTSAEQYERILWQMVEKQQWNKVTPLFSTTLVWNADGKSMSSDQVVAYLQSLGLKDAVVGDVSVRPNGPDMTVKYTLQFSGPGGTTRNSVALSVWQQMKNGSYILIAHSQQPSSGSPVAALQ